MFNRSRQYSECYQLTKKYGTSYFYSALLLNRSERKHIYALYSLCHYADDLVDVDDGKPGTTLNAKSDLLTFKNDVFSAIENGSDDSNLLGAISKTWNQLSLPIEYLERFFRSMEMDLAVTSYETFDDLLIYMEGSAAVIGEMVLPVIEPDYKKHDEIRESARALGNAFQLTSLLRVVGEDALRGRTYIPLKDFSDFGLDPNNFEIGRAFRDLMKFEIDRNREFYRQAYPGVIALKGRRGACVRTAYRLYGGILDEIESNGFDTLSNRVRLSGRKKLST